MMILTATACKKDKDDSNGDVSVINATSIVGDNDDEVDNVKALTSIVDYYDDEYHYVGEYEIAAVTYKNSRFRITLPATLPDGCLMELGKFQDGVTVSDINVKGTSIEVVYAYDKHENQVGHFHLRRYEKDENGFCAAIWLYVDVNCTIKGSEFYDNNGNHYNYKYDCNLKKGWNIVYLYREIHQMGTDSYSWEDTVTTKKPAGVELKWHYVNFGNYYDKTSEPKTKIFPMLDRLQSIKN